MQQRVGMGFDVHRFSEDPKRPLMMGGIEVRPDRGLIGHSDADVVTHAVIDALLGAAGLGDIGEHFADSDAQWAGADSMTLLSHTVASLNQAGWKPGNVDCTVVAEAPKIAPVRSAMVQQLQAVVGCAVNVKASRAEGLGALGRVEGIACWAVAMINAKSSEE